LLKFELHLCVEKPMTAIELLSGHCDLSINQLKQAIQKGALWLTKAQKIHTQNLTNKVSKSHNKYTQRLRRVKNVLQLNDTLHFYYDESVLTQQTAPAQLISDQQTYSIWYKPYGMLCQGSKWSDHCTINRYVENNIKPQRPAFIVHRLDRAASGLVIIAHSKKIARSFSTMFEDHQLNKIYHIICHGDHRSHPQPEEITLRVDDKPANSLFTLLDYNSENDLSLLEVSIGSGRKHQIRKHSASINLPVVGDRLHGNNDFQYDNNLNLQLCAVSLTFKCPTSNTEQYIELPESLRPNIEKVVSLL
jgi:tRNA pseudouridine32 synthase/23S rRNA pseudouridine746 synthase